MTNIRRKLIYPALVGAAYATLTMVLAPISYGGIQLRISEVLCLLPFFLPETAVGLFVGCALANTISTAGLLDIIFGSLATLIACALTALAGRNWRRGDTLQPPALKSCLLAIAPPVLCNGVIVGAVLAWAFTPEAFWPGFGLFGLQVAAGELAVLLALGLPVMRLLPRLLRQLNLAGGV